MRNLILTESEARRRLAPLQGLFSACIQKAAEDWRLLCERGRDLLIGSSTATQASFMSDKVRYYVSAGLHSESSAELERKPRQTSVLIGGELRTRFKKLDKSGRPRFSDTQAANRFITQQQEFNFPGEERRITNAVIGFQLSPDGTRIVSIRCLCPMGKDKHWSFELPLDGLSGIIPIETQQSPVRVRAKSRKSQVNEHED